MPNPAENRSIMATDAPLISIVVPVYNYANYVARAIKSALAQDYPNVEVVVVDDGSTDDTAKVVAQFDTEVEYVYQENRGLAGARNTGIAKATGSAIFFLDADDQMDTNVLTKLSGVLDNSGEDTGLAACLPRLIEIKDGAELPVTLPELPVPPENREILWRDIAIGTLFPCTVLVRKNVFDNCGGFDETFGKMGCEDRDMWLRIGAKYRLQLLRERLVTLYFHGSNMSEDPYWQLKGIRKLMQKARGMGVVSKLNFTFWAQVRSQYHVNASLLYQESGKQLRAFGHVLASIAVCPFPRPLLRERFHDQKFIRLRRLISVLK